MYNYERFKRLGMMCLWGLNFALLLWVVKVYFSALLLAPVNNDAGTFLSIVEKIRSGSILFKDLNSGYTPFAFYTLAWVRNLTPAYFADYTVYLGTVFAFMFGQGVLVYLTLRGFKITRSLSVFAALWMLLLLADYEGLYVFLEPFVAFWGLLATYLILKNKNTMLFLGAAGVCACLSMLSKQYGALALPVFILYLWVSRQKFIWFLVGYALPLIGFGFYYCVLHSIPPMELFNQLRGAGYATHGWMAMGDFTFEQHFRFLLARVPFVLLVPLAIYLKPEFRRVILLLSGLCILLALSLLIRPWGHYFGLIIAYAVILEVVVLTIVQKNTRFLWVLTLVFIGVSSFQAYDIFNSVQFDSRARPYQLVVAQEINKTWPAGTKVLFYLAPEFMWLGHFDPIDNKRPSYGFLSNISGAEQVEYLSKAQHVLIDTQDQLYFSYEKEKIEREGKALYDILAEKNFKLIKNIADRYQLWSK